MEEICLRCQTIVGRKLQELTPTCTSKYGHNFVPLHKVIQEGIYAIFIQAEKFGLGENAFIDLDKIV